MVDLWIVWRYVCSRRVKFFNMATGLSVLGMAIGVSALVIAMSVVSGFESALQQAVIDVTGHLLVIKRGEALEPMENLEPRLRKAVPSIETIAPFVHIEGMVAHQGKIGGIIVQGFNPQTVEQTLNLSGRLKEGRFDLGNGLEKNPPALIGRALAENFKLKVGDTFSIVLPKNNPSAKVLGFSARVKKFQVAGVLDLGMYQYDSRYVLTSSRAAQDLGGVPETFFTGVRLKLKDKDFAQDAGFILASELGMSYLTRDWYESNHNLFEAIKIERVVIFIVLLFVTLAACFNISSTLFVSVLRRYGDISILKVIGANKKRLVRFFTIQGVIIGVIGATLGLILGLTVCLIIAKTNLIYVPAEIYHLGRLPVDVRPLELILIFITSIALCIVSTFAPALRGARLNPVEGLKYD